jgi:DNA mismatch repair protein MutL
LLFPLTLSFSSTQLALLRDLKEQLAFIGFVFRTDDKNTIEVSGIPVYVSESDIPIVLEQILSDFQEEIPDNGFLQTDFFAKSLSQTLAIKTGVFLNKEAQETLVNNLFACKEPAVSPFNKPVFITITLDELDKKIL